VLVWALAGCTPANRPPHGEAVGTNSAPPEPLPKVEASVPAGGASGQISWFSDFGKAKEQAKALHRPILVDFGADWCSWCTKLDEEVWPDPKVVKAAAPFVCAKVDGDENPELMERFGVSGLPTVMAIDVGGRVLGKAVGFQDVEAMTKFLASSK
jgi:thiol:disulfide interchange protein DsbD